MGEIPGKRSLALMHRGDSRRRLGIRCFLIAAVSFLIVVRTQTCDFGRSSARARVVVVALVLEGAIRLSSLVFESAVTAPMWLQEVT